MPIDRGSLVEIFAGEAPEKITPQNKPNATRKRGRGRPRKSHALDWLQELAFTAFDEWSVEPNLTAETRAQFKYLCEENRRERAGDAVREAYAQGRNTANHTRQTIKKRRQLAFIERHLDRALDGTLSASQLADEMIRSGQNCELGRRAIIDVVCKFRTLCRAK